jgi:hypothetical protein
MITLHILVATVDPMSDRVSDYLSSDHAVLARSTFLALGIALAALGLGLRPYYPRSVLSRTSVALLLVAVVGFVGVAIAPQAARYFGIPTQPAAVLSILLLSIGLRQQPRWSRVGTILVLIGGGLLTIYLFTIVLGVLVSLGFGGLANRAVLILIYTWVAFVALGMLRGSNELRAGAP